MGASANAMGCHALGGHCCTTIPPRALAVLAVFSLALRVAAFYPSGKEASAFRVGWNCSNVGCDQPVLVRFYSEGSRLLPSLLKGEEDLRAGQNHDAASCELKTSIGIVLPPNIVSYMCFLAMSAAAGCQLLLLVSVSLPQTGSHFQMLMQSILGLEEANGVGCGPSITWKQPPEVPKGA